MLTGTQADTTPSAPMGDAVPSQLLTDDNGDTDLGDFQYVLFNAIGLTFFLGDFIGDLASGFPVLPPLLTGLLLTSTAGYGAKKLLPQVPPTLTSVIPPAAMPRTASRSSGTTSPCRPPWRCSWARRRRPWSPTTSCSATIA